MAFLGARGASGEVRAGGRLVARLGGWEAVRVTDSGKNGRPVEWAIGAGLTEVNDLWLISGQAYELRLAVGKSQWRWRDVVIQRAGDSVSMTATGRFERL